MSSYTRIFIQTFNSNLDYDGNWIEVTSDVDFSGIGSIKQQIDNNDFDVGTFKFSDFNLRFRNEHGRFSDVGVLQSIFQNRREDSLVRIDWSEGKDNEPICGIAICGEAILHQDITIFTGLINDVASFQNLKDNKITFKVQPLESIFARVEVNQSALNALGGSDPMSDYIHTLINQSIITNLITVDDSNISCGIDHSPDDVSELEGKTVKDALDQFLAASNSVLYIDNSNTTVYVKPREESAASMKTFYGQGSNSGAENIIDIKNYTTGLNRTFNLWRWAETGEIARDTSSISRYGVKDKEVSSEVITNTTKKGNLLSEYRDEFAFPKREFVLSSPLDYSTSELFLLDKVNVDYPTLFYPSRIGGSIPIWGAFEWGDGSEYPVGVWNLTIDGSDNFKIISRSLNLKNSTVEYRLREA